MVPVPDESKQVQINMQYYWDRNQIILVTKLNCIEKC